jgi:hypothetical protein
VGGSRLNMYRCRVRSAGETLTVECLAMTPAAAAYGVAREELRSGRVLWVQVAVSEWSGALGEYIEPENVLIFAPSDTPPQGVDDVIFTSSKYG